MRLLSYSSTTLISMSLAATMTGCTPGLEPVDSPAPRPTEVSVDEVDGVLDLELLGDPAERYEAGDEEVIETALTRAVKQRFPDLDTAHCLQRAARAHSTVPDAIDHRLPLSFTEFTLHWAGCPDPSATVGTVNSTDDSLINLMDHVADLMRQERFTHFGVAATEADPPYRHRWVVLLVRRRFTMEPIPTIGEPGTTLPLQFRVEPSIDDVDVAVTRPDGSVRLYDTGIAGGIAVAGIPLADAIGQQWIELIGHDGDGPQVLALFPIQVGRSPTSRWVGRTRPDESWIDSHDEAEQLAMELIRADRSRCGMAELVYDPDLAAIARAHSADMAANGFFAHVSPITGNIVHRLEAAGYAASYVAENIAMGQNLTESEEGLMRSPGHRAAILSHEATHVGVGVVTIEVEGVGRVHHLTQVFARRRG